MARRRTLTTLAVIQLVVLLMIGAIQYLLADRNLLGIVLAGFAISWMIVPLGLTLFAAARKRNWLAAWVAVIGIVILAICCDLRIRPVSSDPADLRVLNYNIEHGHRGMAGLVRAINELEPDVAMFQEGTMKWEPSHVTVQDFGKALPAYQIAVNEDRIVLSKYPILESSHRWLGPRKTRKSAQIVKIDLDGIPTTLVNIHMLPPSAGGGTWENILEHRRGEYRDLFRLLEEINGPVILGGDFNGTARGPHYDWLRKHFASEAFADVGQGFGFTVPTELPLRRIDMVFASAEFEPLRCWVGPQRASDHRPVVAEYRVRSASPGLGAE